MNEEIFKKVKKVVIEQLEVEDERVVEEATFIEDLEADSLDIVELIMVLEEEFGIEIPDIDVSNLRTVGDVVKYIEDCQNRRD